MRIVSRAETTTIMNILVKVVAMNISQRRLKMNDYETANITREQLKQFNDLTYDIVKKAYKLIEIEQVEDKFPGGNNWLIDGIVKAQRLDRSDVDTITFTLHRHDSAANKATIRLSFDRLTMNDEQIAEKLKEAKEERKRRRLEEKSAAERAEYERVKAEYQRLTERYEKLGAKYGKDSKEKKE